MKSLILTVATATGLLVGGGAFAGEQTALFNVPAMQGCPSCPYIVQSVIEDVSGVKSVKTNYSEGTATVVFDDTLTSTSDIQAATAAYGYDASLVAPVKGS